MAGLFDMPGTRSNREADLGVAKKSKTKSAPAVSTRVNGLIDRINLIVATVQQKLGKYESSYAVIRTEQELQTYIDACIKNQEVALDTETTGLNPMQDKIAGVCLYTPGQKGVYIPINHESYVTGQKLKNQILPVDVARALIQLRSANVKFIMHNAKFDIRVIEHQLGVKLSCYFDTLLASQLLNENEPHGLKALHQKYVLNGVGDAWSFGALFKDIQFTKIPIDTAYLYAARDPHITYELYKFQLPYLTVGTEECVEQELEGVSSVFWNIEMPFLDVCIEMEDNGISFDMNYQQELHEKYNKLKDEKYEAYLDCLKEYQPKIDEYNLSQTNSKLSDPINISSPTQLAILFYDILGVGEIDRKSPRGTGEDILKKMNLPICNAILEYRGVDKLINTYVDKLPNTINPNTERIHAVFNQYGAKTGRLSSENPNMQNIPSHNKDIRKLFVSRPAYVMMSSDYSQQEPRAMAALCGDEGMLQAYREGKDLYAQIASVSFHRKYEDCLEFYLDENGKKTDKTNKEGKEYRSRAKSILLGVLYGRGIASIAEQLNCTTQEAQAIKDSVFKGFPAIKRFEEDTLRMAEEKGYVTTFWGRKRRLPEMQLPTYEYEYIAGHGDADPLSFDNSVENLSVPLELQQKYDRMLSGARFGQKRKIFEKINAEGVKVIDNEMKIADATRQCVNARIQGSAADLSKLAGIKMYQNERLRELGFKLLIPIHDEFLAECPEENAKECKELFSKCMCDAAVDLGIPISCDVTVTKQWYGEEVEL